ncbi:MAG TPA: MurT ligase domain-containing protein, partial [Solirubrobacteraceae bacterium]|nr:MurT ligase domain-containing protein [Solirubrobacteraceae bacterium]
MMLAPKLAAAKAVGGLVRRAGRGGGTSLPGKLLTRLEPHAIGLLAGRLAHGSVVISATNGKTTTAAMVAAVLERSGRRLVHNRAGANMAGGVASALADASRRGGRELDGDLGLFEVDEFWLGPVVEELEPRALLLGNLFRDQLDRYGELETIADRWAAVVTARAGRSRLVLNADDPLVADLGRDEAPLYYGVQDDAMAHAELQHASDSKHCRHCGHAYVYEAAYMGHLGRYHCPNCGNRRPEPAVAAEAVELRGIRSAAFTLRSPAGSTRVELPLPGLYNVYNALGAAALCLALDVPLADVAAGLAAVEPAFGRAETLDLGGRATSILLVKNPAGANEVLRTLALEGGRLDLFGVLNDGIADGRDVSWVWDADWEILVPHVERMTCSGTRAAELALRLKYAGVPVERLHVVDDLA